MDLRRTGWCTKSDCADQVGVGGDDIACASPGHGAKQAGDLERAAPPGVRATVAAAAARARTLCTHTMRRRWQRSEPARVGGEAAPSRMMLCVSQPINTSSF
jgi:hypothetical protein